MSWVLFATATSLASLLLLWLISGKAKQSLTQLLTTMDAKPFWSTMAVTLVMIAAMGGCWWLGGRLLIGHGTKWKRLPLAIAINLPAAFFLFVAIQFVARVVNHTNEPLLTVILFLLPIIGYLIFFIKRIVPDANKTHPIATIVGLAAAIMLSFALQAIAALFSDHFEGKDKIGLIARYMTIVLVVFLPTLGGAMRFLSEKLAIEAEALSYRDAHVWFEHAKDLLCERRPGRGDPKADKRAQNIVRQLGTLAIYENQAWLKLRRERPLSPVI